MQKLNKVLENVNNVIFILTEWICRIMLGCQVLICAGIFVGRYFFKITPAWGEPSALFCLVWLCILSSALAIRDDSHLRMTVFDEKMPPKMLLVLDIITTIVVFCFAVFMITAGFNLVKLSRNNIVPGINIPASYMNLVMPVTGVIYIAALIEQWRRRITGCHRK